MNTTTESRAAANRPAYGEVGSLVKYRPFIGGAVVVRVTAVHADIKNGRPGFDGVIAEGADAGAEVWGYADQILL
jgi:NAD(P)H-dependent flavin oxidoreductase YrpB (nitropropane dioxygenase family)